MEAPASTAGHVAAPGAPPSVEQVQARGSVALIEHAIDGDPVHATTAPATATAAARTPPAIFHGLMGPS
jgi:hypothetical protein